MRQLAISGTHNFFFFFYKIVIAFISTKKEYKKYLLFSQTKYPLEFSYHSTFIILHIWKNTSPHEADWVAQPDWPDL